MTRKEFIDELLKYGADDIEVAIEHDTILCEFTKDSIRLEDEEIVLG